jgi:glyoxylase-like metal-dependent hydrolase (beta-lactamase superfamily II)
VLPLLRALAAREVATPRELAIALGRANALEERAPRIEFTPGVWMLPVRSRTLPPATHTNVWLPGGRRFAIVDPGSDEPVELARLAAVVERRRDELGHEPAAVLLTHAHRDHTAGALALASRYRLPVAAHVSTLEALGGEGHGIERRPIEDGTTIDLDGVTLDAHHTPGHAPGHLAFGIRPGGALIAGDLISGLSTILIDPRQGDMDAYLASLELARGMRSTVLLPGHGPPLAAVALDRLIAHRTEREARILERLAAGPVTLAVLARAAYAGAGELPAALIEGQTLSHLVRLEKRGRARREDPSGTSWRGLASGAHP